MRTKFVAVFVATLVFALGWFFLGFKPSSARLKEVKGEIETTRTEIAALTARLKRLQELKANEAQLRADFERYNKGLPAKPAVSDFIRQVQGAANESGIDFITISPAEPVDAAPTAAAAPTTPTTPSTGGAAAEPQAAANAYRSIDVTLSLGGTFFSVEDFVSKLERLERAVRISTFSLSEQGDGDDPRLDVAITMQMFMSGAPAAPAAPAPAAPAPTTAP